MRPGHFALSTACVLAAAPAGATLITFEGVPDRVLVLDFYAGGTDGAGNTGPDLGVSFSRNLMAVVDQDAGGTGNFANEPSPDTAGGTLPGEGRFVMNVASGFVGSLSFCYSHGFNDPDPGTVGVFSGIDGTGELLGGATLPRNVFFGGECGGDPAGDFCRWDPVTVTFGGMARSAVFLASPGRLGIDSIGIGDVPEPGMTILLGLGLAALGAMRRRRRRVAHSPDGGHRPQSGVRTQRPRTISRTNLLPT